MNPATASEVRTLREIGDVPAPGDIPQRMNAWTIRRRRYGEPLASFRLEEVEVPPVGEHQVLVQVQAAGINYNGVWAGRGVPVDVIPRQAELHIAGTDASGIVARVGAGVTDLRVGDEVVLHGAQWDRDCPLVRSGGDPVNSSTFRIWGYETSWGSFAQWARVQDHQCFPKPPHLSWEAAAAYLASGIASYRMLHHWDGNAVRPGDVVLVWGGAGGLGCQAIQIAREAGATPVAVISDRAKAEFCRRLGAVGCIDRTEFSHWGPLPHWSDETGFQRWLKGDRKAGEKGALQFRRALWKALGEKRDPQIVIEHPGEDTLATSLFVCAPGGMVVTCAGTTGYSPVVDLRYLWMRQKRIQGSHAGNLKDVKGINDLVTAKRVDPCLSRTFAWEELAAAHQLMADNRHPPGNMAVLVGAPTTGLGRRDS